MNTQRRRVHTVSLLVRPRGSAEPYRKQAFKAHATSPHHAELMARAFAEKTYDIGQPH